MLPSVISAPLPLYIDLFLNLKSYPHSLSTCLSRAPAPALQPAEGHLGAGVGPPHEETLGRSGGEAARGTRAPV